MRTIEQIRHEALQSSQAYERNRTPAMSRTFILTNEEYLALWRARLSGEYLERNPQTGRLSKLCGLRIAILVE